MRIKPATPIAILVSALACLRTISMPLVILQTSLLFDRGPFFYFGHDQTLRKKEQQQKLH